MNSSVFVSKEGSYSFQVFTLWQNINHLRIAAPGKETRGLTDEQRLAVFDLCHQKKDVKYTALRKLLALGDDEVFTSLSYGEKTASEVEKAAFNYLKPYL